MQRVGIEPTLPHIHSKILCQSARVTGLTRELNACVCKHEDSRLDHRTSLEEPANQERSLVTMLVFARSFNGEAPYHWATAAFMKKNSILGSSKGSCCHKVSVFDSVHVRFLLFLRVPIILLLYTHRDFVHYIHLCRSLCLRLHLVIMCR